MSQMEPYDYSQMPPGDDDDFEPMQAHSGSWQPGWRPPHAPPPGPRPPYGPPWPPGPGAGGWPFWGYWGFRLRSAWRDVKFLNKLIGDIINDMIENGIVAPGPNSPVQGPSGGIPGVTDGSNAGPGQIGEFVSFSSAISYAVATGQTFNISLGVLAPGDWDLRSSLQFSTPFDGVSYYLNPMPSGFSNAMFGELLDAGSAGLISQYAVVVGMAARGSVSVPTLMPFTVNVNSSAAGQATLTIEARRMR